METYLSLSKKIRLVLRVCNVFAQERRGADLVIFPDFAVLDWEFIHEIY
jgi:hypothetical protein